MKVEGVLTGWQLPIFSATLLRSKELITQVIDLSGGRPHHSDPATTPLATRATARTL